MKSTSNPLTQVILKALQSAPAGMTRTEIRALFHSHKRSPEIHRALRQLYDRGCARFEVIPTRGRPVERWFVADSVGPAGHEGLPLSLRLELPHGTNEAVTATIPRRLRSHPAVVPLIRTAARILYALQLTPTGLTLSALRRTVGRHRPTAEIHRALWLLHSTGLAAFYVVPTKGRPARLWFAV